MWFICLFDPEVKIIKKDALDFMWGGLAEQ